MYKKTILKNISWLSLQELAFQVLGIGFYVLLARSLNPDGLGLYAYIFTIMGFVGLFLDFGLMTHFWRKWSTDVSQVKQDIESLLGSKILIVIPVSIILYSYLTVTDREHLWPFTLAYIYTFLDMVKLVPLYFFQAKNEFGKVVAINISDKGLAFVVAGALLFFGHTLTAVLTVFVLSRMVSIAVGYGLVRLSLMPRINLLQVKLILQSSFLLTVVYICNNVYGKIDAVIIRQMLDIAQVGAYSASYRILESLTLIPNIMVMALFVPMTQLSQNSNREYSLGLLKTAIKYLMIVAVFVAVFFQFYANEILDFLYGGTYLISGPVLRVLGWVTVFMFTNSVISTYLITHHQEVKLFKRLAFLIIFNIVANILVIPLLGIQGAAITTLLTEIIGLLAFVKILKVNLFELWVVKLTLVAGVLALALALVHWYLFPTLIVAGVLYLIALTALKVIYIQELWPS